MPYVLEVVLVVCANWKKASQADRKGAIFHLGGLARLLQTCGPEAFQEQPLRNAFESARAIQVRQYSIPG